jgi:cardiolipin synthase
VQVAAYNPLVSAFFQGRLLNRLHRKIIIIDGKKAFIGGQNIGDEYLSRDEKIGYWKDTGLVFSGDAVLSSQQIFFSDWLQASGEKVMGIDFYPDTPAIENKTITIITGNPDSPLTNMSIPYIQMINSAKEKIYIVTPYFFPDAATLGALYQTAGRNVDIHILLPDQSDHILLDITKPLYIKKLLAHGIKVSTYNRGFNHSKIIIIDDSLASIGTANMEKFGFFKSYEVTCVIYDNKKIKELQNDFLNDISSSTTHSPVSK